MGKGLFTRVAYVYSSSDIESFKRFAHNKWSRPRVPVKSRGVRSVSHHTARSIERREACVFVLCVSATVSIRSLDAELLHNVESRQLLCALRFHSDEYADANEKFDGERDCF
jgi:hypothetical protein